MKPIFIVWSVPRSRSTVFERAIHERGDLLCIHEPFSRMQNFGQAEVAGIMCRSNEQIIERLVNLASTTAIFIKDTTDFDLSDIFDDTRFIRLATHAVMWRSPAATIDSHLRVNPEATISEIGYTNMEKLVRRLVSVTDVVPHFIEGDDFATSPNKVMERYCKHTGLIYFEDSITFSRPAPDAWSTTAKWHEEAAMSTSIRSESPPRKPLTKEISALKDHFVSETAACHHRLNILVSGGS